MAAIISEKINTLDSTSIDEAVEMIGDMGNVFQHKCHENNVLDNTSQG